MVTEERSTAGAGAVIACQSAGTAISRSRAPSNSAKERQHSAWLHSLVTTANQTRPVTHDSGRQCQQRPSGVNWPSGSFRSTTVIQVAAFPERRTAAVGRLPPYVSRIRHVLIAAIPVRGTSFSKPASRCSACLVIDSRANHPSDGRAERGPT